MLREWSKNKKNKNKKQGCLDGDFAISPSLAQTREKRKENLCWLVDIRRQFVVVCRSVERAFFFNTWHTAPSNHFPSPIARPRVTVQILCAKENAMHYFFVTLISCFRLAVHRLDHHCLLLPLGCLHPRRYPRLPNTRVLETHQMQ
jgi:hypothetical protein